MSPDVVAAWISAGAALLSLLGAGFAWWREHLSREAKKAAEAARDHATSTLTAIERLATESEAQSASLRKVAAGLERPILTLTRVGERRWELSSREPVTIEEFVNSPEIRGFGLDTPLTLSPNVPATFTARPTLGSPTPPALIVKLADRADPIRLTM